MKEHCYLPQTGSRFTLELPVAPVITHLKHLIPVCSAWVTLNICRHFYQNAKRWVDIPAVLRWPGDDVDKTRLTTQWSQWKKWTIKFVWTHTWRSLEGSKCGNRMIVWQCISIVTVPSFHILLFSKDCSDEALKICSWFPVWNEMSSTLLVAERRPIRKQTTQRKRRWTKTRCWWAQSVVVRCSLLFLETPTLH